MEKSFPLDQPELVLIAQLDQEKTQQLAIYGALAIDMKQAEKNLEALRVRQESFIRQAVFSRGIAEFQTARAQNGQLLVVLPDSPAPAPMLAPALIEGKADKKNGAVVNTKE